MLYLKKIFSPNKLLIKSLKSLPDLLVVWRRINYQMAGEISQFLQFLYHLLDINFIQIIFYRSGDLQK